MTDDAQLFDAQGRRLYLTGEERAAFLAAAARAPRQVRTFCGLLHFTGCRLSEALAVTPRRVDLAGQAVVFETLKKRRSGIYRGVPVPESYLDTLDMVHGLRERQTRSEGPLLDAPLWAWSRTTGYRRVIEVMAAAGIEDGPHRCPKGLRHGYGVAPSAPPCRSTCSENGWATPRSKPPPSMPTPSEPSSAASPPGCGRRAIFDSKPDVFIPVA